GNERRQPPTLRSNTDLTHCDSPFRRAVSARSVMMSLTVSACAGMRLRVLATPVPEHRNRVRRVDRSPYAFPQPQPTLQNANHGWSLRCASTATRCGIIYDHRLEHASRTRHKLWIVGTVDETLFTGHAACGCAVCRRTATLRQH